MTNRPCYFYPLHAPCAGGENQPKHGSSESPLGAGMPEHGKEGPEIPEATSGVRAHVLYVLSLVLGGIKGNRLEKLLEGVVSPEKCRAAEDIANKFPMVADGLIKSVMDVIFEPDKSGQKLSSIEVELSEGYFVCLEIKKGGLLEVVIRDSRPRKVGVFRKMPTRVIMFKGVVGMAVDDLKEVLAVLLQVADCLATEKKKEDGDDCPISDDEAEKLVGEW